MKPNFYTVSSKQLVPDMRTKKGQTAVVDILQQLCGFALDSKEKQAVLESEMDGIKEKLFELSHEYGRDKENIRSSLKSFKEQENKISQVVHRTNQVMKIVDDFTAF